jgi:hypothetical protein
MSTRAAAAADARTFAESAIEPPRATEVLLVVALTTQVTGPGSDGVEVAVAVRVGVAVAGTDVLVGVAVAAAVLVRVGVAVGGKGVLVRVGVAVGVLPPPSGTAPCE